MAPAERRKIEDFAREMNSDAYIFAHRKAGHGGSIIMSGSKIKRAALTVLICRQIYRIDGLVALIAIFKQAMDEAVKRGDVEAV